MPLLKKARSTNTPRFLDYLVTWQSEFARVPPRAPEPLNTGTLGTRLTNGMLPSLIFLKYKMATNFDQVLEAIGNENFEFNFAGISSDEEEDLDRRLEMSDSDSRQVFTFF